VLNDVNTHLFYEIKDMNAHDKYNEQFNFLWWIYGDRK